jgi:putative metalloprotease
MTLWLPLVLAVLYAIVSMRFSVWRTQKMLDANSHPLSDPALGQLTDRMAAALDLPRIEVHVFDVDPVNGLGGPDGRIFLTRVSCRNTARARSVTRGTGQRDRA